MMYLGIDLGGTNISAGITDENGNILVKASTPTMNGRETEDIIDDMAELSKRLMTELKVSEKDIEAVGIGMPGTMDKKKGISLYANNLNFNNVNVVDEMKKRIDLPCYIENDANCAAIGENVCGVAYGNKNIIYITIGTGVGAGIIINGKVFDGSFGGGGEAGHMVIVAEGEECTCGRKGCWEAYASATALRREGRIAAAKYPNSKIYDLVDGNIKLIDAKTVFDAADMGDEVANGIVDMYIKYVAIGLVNLVNIFQPETIIIGGGVCAQGDKLIKPITKILNERVYGGELKTKICVATLGNDAGIVGAAMLGKINREEI
ncbi:MAG: ROK family protein [Clostridia bacterium]|nr:ROK family protein [Clostridia bacterium]